MLPGNRSRKERRRFELSADATSLSESLELTRVQFFEISAKVSESSEPTKKPSKELDKELLESKELLEFHIGIKNEKKNLGLRVSMDLSNEHIVARIDCAVFFRKLDPERRYDPAEIKEFIRGEALPILVPYIRETLADISRRVVGKSITIGSVHVVDDMVFTDDLHASL